ncbi:MAG: alcohol dehydrogenase catalytic domain-containing protein [Rectinemataceae bacterium]
MTKENYPLKMFPIYSIKYKIYNILEVGEEMKAIVWQGKGWVENVGRARPVEAIGEVLLRVITAGICGTDLTIYQGKFDATRSVPPLIPGHEICGVIEKIGEGVNGWNVGDRVAVDPLIPCGVCYACRHGVPHVCTSLKLLGVDRDGGFAEYVTVAAVRLHRLPAGISDVEGALVEPLAVAVHDVRLGGLALGDTALVVGAGPIGLLIAMAARAAGARRIAVSEFNDHRRSIAEGLGFPTYSPSNQDFRDCIRDEFDGIGPDIAFDATGSAAGYQSAIDCVRVRGRIVQVGIPKGPTEIDLRRMNFAELSIVGTRVYSPEDITGAIDLLEHKRVEAQKLASVHSLEECGNLLAELSGGETKLMKPVLRIAG